MTMGSLFDGIGGFPLAAVHNDIVPVWASEIEAFPIRVTKVRFPDMIHVGDITKLKGGELPPVHVICGGSPCQDLSVAGLRKGLAGERSGLFMEQVRVVKEMRAEDEKNGRTDIFIRPRYMVWENVPGAFSSADGEDFRTVLTEIIRIKAPACDVPEPDTGRWGSVGAVILGNQFSLAWRVLDAQYWGVPQRRRRIFLVADFGGLSAPEILFKQESLSGDFEENEKRSSAAGGTGRNPADPGRNYLKEEVLVFHLNQRDEVIDLQGVSGALLATSNMQMRTFVSKKVQLYDSHGIGAKYTGPHPVAPTMTATYGKGGNNVPLITEEEEFDPPAEDGKRQVRGLTRRPVQSVGKQCGNSMCGLYHAGNCLFFAERSADRRIKRRCFPCIFIRTTCVRNQPCGSGSFGTLRSLVCWPWWQCLFFHRPGKSFRFCRPHAMHFCPSALKIPAFSTLSGIRCPTIW